MEKQNNNFTTDLFQRIDSMKRQRILDIAIEEFANNGYNNANVNRIAEKAGISVGSLYKYFETKDNLFLYIVDEASLTIQRYTKEVLDAEASVLEKFQKLLNLAHEYSIEEPNIIKLYNVFTSDNDENRASLMAEKLERITSSAYRELINEAQKKGEVRDDINPAILAFMIDNQLIVTQFSFANSYYMKRLKLYMNHDGVDDIDVDEMNKGMMLALRSMLKAN